MATQKFPKGEAFPVVWFLFADDQVNMTASEDSLQKLLYHLSKNSQLSALSLQLKQKY
jgi:hypothetical protein